MLLHIELAPLSSVAFSVVSAQSIIHCQLYLAPAMDAHPETLRQALSAGDLNVLRKIVAEKDVSNIFASNSRQVEAA